MSILDTTVYFRSTYTQEYVPFENDNYNEDKYDNDKWDNFCPKCHYNYHSNYHRKHCNNEVPIGDGLFILLFMAGFFIIYKRLKNKSINN